jgi:hypothetical protein
MGLAILRRESGAAVDAEDFLGRAMSGAGALLVYLGSGNEHCLQYAPAATAFTGIRLEMATQPEGSLSGHPAH